MAAKTVADVMNMVKENEVKFVDFRFTDTRGKEQHVTVPISALRRRQVHRRPCLRRLVDRRLEGHRGVRHAAHAGPEHRQHRPVLRRADADPDLRRRRAGRRQALRARSALARQARRGLHEGLGPGRRRLLRPRARVLHLRQRALAGRHVGLLLQDRVGGSLLEHGQGVRARQLRLPADGQGRLLPDAADRLHAGHALRDVPDPRVAGHSGRGPPPRGGAGADGDRHQVLDAGRSAPTGCSCRST